MSVSFLLRNHHTASNPRYDHTAEIGNFIWAFTGHTVLTLYFEAHDCSDIYRFYLYLLSLSLDCLQFVLHIAWCQLTRHCWKIWLQSKKFYCVWWTQWTKTEFKSHGQCRSLLADHKFNFPIKTMSRKKWLFLAHNKDNCKSTSY